MHELYSNFHSWQCHLRELITDSRLRWFCSCSEITHAAQTFVLKVEQQEFFATKLPLVATFITDSHIPGCVVCCSCFTDNPGSSSVCPQGGAKIVCCYTTPLETNSIIDHRQCWVLQLLQENPHNSSVCPQGETKRVFAINLRSGKLLVVILSLKIQFFKFQ